MKKTPSFVMDREKEFFQWLSTQVTAKQLSDLYIILPVINEYGKKRSHVAESLFELGNGEHAKKFRKMVQEDKRFQFVHYGQSKQILLLLAKYCEYFESKEKTAEKIASATAERESVRLAKAPVGNKPIPEARKSGSVVLRTKSGANYYGDTPAEALASLCEKLALSNSKAFQRLIGEPYYGHGSVVLFATKPSNGGVWVNQGFCYIDSTLQRMAAQYYGQWLCKMLGDLDLPVSITVFDKKPDAKEQKQESVGSAEKVETKRPSEPSVKQEIVVKPTNASSGRDQAIQPAAPAKQEFVSQPVKTSRSRLDADLNALLAGNEYAQLRDELVSQKVTSLAQFKKLDLWSFMNWAGLYSIGRRQEICKQIKALLEPQEEKNIEKQYCLKTLNGKCYYGNTPSKALAAYCNNLASGSPLTIRKLIGRRYNDIGMVVLHADMPENGGIQLSNPTAYLSSDLTEKAALYYAIWLCRKCKEPDEPVSLAKVAKESSTDKSKGIQPKVEEKSAEIADEPQDGLTGENWLFSILAKKGIQYEDKRDNHGCLWILGGHELDMFVKQCAAKGYGNEISAHH